MGWNKEFQAMKHPVSKHETLSFKA